jgi:hypothetical protein
LWSRRAAEEIVELLVQDIADGLLAADAGADLVRRVWGRTQPDELTGIHPRPVVSGLGVNPRPAAALSELAKLHKAG